MHALTRLHGFNAWRNPEQPVGLSSISFIASTTSTSNTIVAPATILAGDLLVLWDCAANSLSIPSTVVPSGFTSLINDSGASIARAIWSAKIAAGDEDGDTITGMNGDSTDRKVMMQFRGDVAFSAFSAAQGSVGELVGGNPGGVSIAASGGTPPLIAFASYGSTGAIDPRTFSAAADAEISAATTGYVKYKIYNSGPADHSIDMDDEGNFNSLRGFYLNMT